MTIHKLTAGDGYTYLTRHVAGGDVDRARAQPEVDYYTAEGNPPGRWIGRGASRLGVAGQTVAETQMRNLFGLGMHPDADPIIHAYQAAHVRAGMSGRQIERVISGARRAATLGRPFPAFQPLAPFEQRVQERVRALNAETGRAPTPAETARVQREEARRARTAVAGYDAVFAPVKSAALLWALDDRAWVRAAVQDAHEEAMASALALLEEHAAFTRAGAESQAQIDTNGLVAVAFDHYDSRDGDPNLHTHLVISNKVQGVDGKWRSLDGRALYRIAVAASEHYNTAFQAALTDRLGVTWTARTPPGAKEAIHEIAGVPEKFVAYYSRRRAAIQTRYADLLAEYRAVHGQDPPPAVAHKLARRANLDTRQGKKAPRSLAAMRAAWTGQLTREFGPDAVDRLKAAVPARLDPAVADPAPDAVDVELLAARVVTAVGERRSTWTRWNLRAEVERLLRAEGHATDQTGHRRLADQIASRATGPQLSVLVEAPAVTDEPAALRRADGTSVFVEHGAARYTSQAVLDAEQRLVTAAQTPTRGALPADRVAAALADFQTREGRDLDEGQRQLVTAFATDPRQLVVGIGAAGTGKTTAMRAYQHVLRFAGRRLIPLATSAASAAVLAAELGTPAENVHKFLHEHAHGPHAAALASGAPVPDSHQLFAVGPGDVLLIDEAGMAGTPNFDRLVAIAGQRGASTRGLGDYRQLAAVESGGALRLIAAEAGAVELSTLHRFTDPAEAAATLRMRIGDTSALDFYQQHDRISGGSRDAMTEAAYTDWWTDVTAGRITLMVAATNTDVTTLGARARADRVAAGHVEADGVQLADGNQAGRGDWIVSRHNERRLACRGGRDFVRNGDGWTVERRHDDGSLTVRHLEHRGRLRLPAAYVAAHVQLLYATTVHRAQGGTVDTAHVLVADQMAREHLYVAATRARHTTRLYVATHDVLPLDEDERLDRTGHDPDSRAAREVLDTILGREAAELSATETIRANQELAGSLATLMPRLAYAAQQAADTHYQQLTAELLDAQSAVALRTDPGWDAVARALQDGERAGWQPAQLLAAALRQGPLNDAESPAKVLAWRCVTAIDDQAPGPWLAQPRREQADRYADLVQQITGQRPDPEQAHTTPAQLRTSHNRHTIDAVDLAARVLGAERTERLHAETAWPALSAALARAHRAGHDPAQLLGNAAAHRATDGAANPPGGRLAQALAEHLHQQINALPATPEPDAWPNLAWALASYQQTGGDPADLLPEPGRPPVSMTELHRHASSRSRGTRTDQADSPALPPWTPAVPMSGPSPRYLAELRDQIAARTSQLADDAARSRPAWTSPLGTRPVAALDRQRWQQALAVVVAYRDQYQVAADDSAHPLGPYIPADKPGHRAYWQAAAALVDARRVATTRLSLHPRQRTEPEQADAAYRVVVDTYRALAEDQRNAIATRIVAQLGDFWHGHDADIDTGVTQPAYARHLQSALTDAGHLDRMTARRRSFSDERGPRRPRPDQQDYPRRRITEQRRQQLDPSQPRHPMTPLPQPPHHQPQPPGEGPRPRL